MGSTGPGPSKGPGPLKDNAAPPMASKAWSPGVGAGTGLTTCSGTQWCQAELDSRSQDPHPSHPPRHYLNSRNLKHTENTSKIRPFSRFLQIPRHRRRRGFPGQAGAERATHLPPPVPLGDGHPQDGADAAHPQAPRPAAAERPRSSRGPTTSTPSSQPGTRPRGHHHPHPGPRGGPVRSADQKPSWRLGC